MLERDIQEILFTEEQLKNRVNEIARQIEADYAGKEIMFIGILRGSFVFLADLCRAVKLPCKLDFMSVSSYGGHVIVVEDILDSGNTLSYLLNILEHRHPADLRLCALLDKPDRRTKPVDLHYRGFSIPDAFVVGYGLDYAEKYRNLPYIGILKPEVYGGV